MNQPLPGPRPVPGPVPGPRPAAPPDESAHTVDPDKIRRQVTELLEQADDIAASVGDDADGEALAQLARQAHLLEKAHGVLTDALEKVDRA
ncbi:hypothetical protein [Williamsia sp. 1138]|uniref:hypothetical protein n=1 Tax=Williamsia sp. 1138 TaxID=1903117 RepID=UPI000A0FEE3D|nr:hypothetical protein [Williamsia sp. 1138]